MTMKTALPFNFFLFFSLVAVGGAPAAEPKNNDSITRADSEAADAILIPDGTVVRLRLIQSVSSATARAGDLLLFTVDEDILVDSVVVIEEGANARGTVTKSKKRRSFGRKEKLDISFDYVRAVNRQKVGLRASHEARGSGNYAAAGVVTYLTGPFGAFVKGKNVTLRAGEQFTVYIAGDRRLRIDS